MSNERWLDNSAEHREVSGLIPWYVNATLDERACRRVDAHVGLCAVCSDDLLVQRRLFEAIDSATTVDYMPMASLRRLQARLDACRCRNRRCRRPRPWCTHAAKRPGAHGWLRRLPA